MSCSSEKLGERRFHHFGLPQSICVHRPFQRRGDVKMRKEEVKTGIKRGY
ncbi:MAG: hypothetical protein ACETWE_08505 [Candidatus Bathyarchaeia archaeon]